LLALALHNKITLYISTKVKINLPFPMRRNTFHAPVYLELQNVTHRKFYKHIQHKFWRQSYGTCINYTL